MIDLIHKNMLGRLNGLLQLTTSMQPYQAGRKHKEMENSIKAQLDQLRSVNESGLSTDAIKKPIQKC